MATDLTFIMIWCR